MMKRIILYPILLLLMSSANAQESAKATPALPAGAASKESVVHLMEVMHAKRNMELAMKGILESAKKGGRQGFLSKLPNATPEQLAIFESMWDELFKDVSYDDMLELTIAIYQRHFTQADVDSLVAFYQTPVGQKMLNETPAIMQESMQAGSDYMLKEFQPKMEVLDKKMKELADTFQKEPGAQSKTTGKSEPTSKKPTTKKQ